MKVNSSLFQILKVVLFATILSMLLVVVSAGLIKVFNIDNSIISILNVVIKVLSIILAIIIFLKDKTNGWLKGLISGLLYALASFLVFSLIASEFKFDLSLLMDVLTCAVAGCVGGIVRVNLFTSKRYGT